MKQKTIKIKLSKVISKSISSRQAVSLVKDKIPALSNFDKVDIILDFSEVNFVSRSFIDEIFNLQEKLRSRKISFEFINMNKVIREILQVTAVHRVMKPRQKVNLRAVDLEKVAYQF